MPGGYGIDNAGNTSCFYHTQNKNKRNPDRKDYKLEDVSEYNRPYASYGGINNNYPDTDKNAVYPVKTEEDIKDIPDTANLRSQDAGT